MANVKRHEKTLFYLFIKQVIGIAGTIVAEVIVFAVLFSIGLNTGVMLPANYVENYLVQIEEQLISSRPFAEELLPEVCEYGLFDFSGNYIQGNSENQDELRAYLTGEMYGSGYKVLTREEGYCVIHYSVQAHFSNPILHKWIPHPEMTAIAVFVIVLLLIVMINALCFGKKLRRKLAPLLDEIEHIKERELQLSTRYSDIREFNEILISLNEMKAALATSLKKEWETEQRRKENISALAHDIKTPLTIIKGNVELLKEESEIEEIYVYADTINENTNRIEHYIQLLIDETKGINEEKEVVDLFVLIAAIKEQCQALCDTKQIPLMIRENWSKHNEQRIEDLERIQRAVLNIVSNAIEHTDFKKGIRMTFAEKHGLICIKVEDYGKGFSEEALLHATEQFYTENKERNGSHYGLGLYFSETVAREHDGMLCIANKEDENGAEVLFYMKVGYTIN